MTERAPPSKREPIAIVGVGCRFPGGVRKLADLHHLLAEGRSAIREVSPDRWSADALYHPDFQKPGHIHARRGGFLEDIDLFDAAFFGISPNEARRMDPQQRLVLETAFEAIEDAGARLEDLAGRDVAVVVGVSGHDYDAIQGATTARHDIGPTTNTGSALSIVANRVSYVFDLRGPSFSLDTACSSSLTAVHHACHAIWSGAASAALAGGVNVILRPEATVGFSKGGYLSPDGECRAFSDHANGYVRGEGAAMVLLKPLSLALSDGDRIHAIVRGSWINQDGRTPGMTMPSQAAQEVMLRAAYREAGVDPRRASYVEAHGTGTQAGDPVEASAIGAVVGGDRPEGEVCYLGSIKTNLGHMESAAGMAGLLKLCLVLGRRVVFPNLHFRAPNPKIAFNALRLRVPTEAIPLEGDGPLYGGVNSFGFGGANAHVVLESPPREAPAVTAAEVERADPQVIFASARSASALRAVAERLAEVVTRSDAPLSQIAAACEARRSRFEFRLAQVGSSRKEIAASLRRFAEAGEAPGLVEARVPEGRPAERVGFVFSGQGPQWWRMGRELLEADPVFRSAVMEVDAELGRLGWLSEEGSSLIGELRKGEAASRMGQTRVAQPCLFALQLGITASLRAHGVTPAAVVGHSIGELAAAVTAGILSVAEGARVVSFRSRCQASAEGRGAMAAIGLPAAEVRALLEAAGGRAEIAAVNGPRAVTIAGYAPEIDAICRDLEAREVFFRKLDVSVPFHSFLMDPIEGEFRRGVGEVAAGAGEVPFYSTVTGGALHGGSLGAEYWWRNIRAPVLFHDGLSAMLRDGLRCFVEIGPHPVLRRGGLEIMQELGARGAFIPTLQHQGDEPVLLRRTLAELYVAGAVVCPVAGLSAGAPGGGPRPRPFVELPPHPMDRQRLWHERRADAAARRGEDRPPHPHLGAIEVGAKARETFSCELAIDARREAYVADHRVQGLVVFPAAGHVEVALAAAREALGEGVFLEDVELKRPIVLPAEEPPALRLEVYSDEGHFVIASSEAPTSSAPANAEAAPWVEHSRGRVNHAGDRFDAPALDVRSLRARITRQIPVDALYREAAEAGLDLGPSFHGITDFRVEGDETLATVEVPAALAAEVERFWIHPAMLDSVIQTAALGSLSATVGRGAALSGGQGGGLFLPFRIGRVRLHRPVRGGPMTCYARAGRREGAALSVSVWAVDERGEPLVSIEGLGLKYIQGSAHTARGVGGSDGENAAYELAWEEAPLAEAHAATGRPRGAFVVLAGPAEDGLVAALGDALGARAERVVLVRPARAARALGGDVHEVAPDRAADFEALARALPEGERVAGVVHLWSLAEPSTESGDADLPWRAAQALGPVSAGHLVAALRERGAWAEGAEAWLVTRGAHAVAPGDEARVQVGAALLWGFGRVLTAEQPRLATSLIDLGADATPDERRALVAAIARGPAEHEIALRGRARYVARLQRVRAEDASRPRPLDAARASFHAVVRSPGVLSSIALEERALRPVGPDEVEIAVRAVGLNFKDVVVAMALLPDEAWQNGMSGAELGMDCAGVVTAVGASVRSVRAGDEVVALAPGCLGNRAIAHECHVVPKPAALGFAEAAALPTVYLTAGIALERLAQLAPGETVLVHAGAGGVGIAAIQMAQRLGARVLATTSSAEKRSFLREMGVEHTLSSRTPTFRDEVLAATEGRGVDVVLNSLSGRALTQGIRCLAPFGRFIEIGKTDIYANRQLGLLHFGENRSYACLDINRWAAQRKRAITPLLARYVEEVASGALRSPPVRSFTIAEAAEAVAHLAQGRHIGKVVVEVPARGAVNAYPGQKLRFEDGGAHVITGGNGGFGLAVARWLVERGARRIVLVGRRGLPGPAEEATVDEMRRAGATVRVVRCDVGDREAVLRLFEDLCREGPIAGVFHAAMVLDDGPIAALSAARYEAVVRPKLGGALHLDEATRGLDLRWFVLFSSIAAIVGTPGQASYAAANAALDALAVARRGRGEPAISINWGVIDGAGVVARASAEQRRKILGQGVAAFSLDEALAILERTLLDAPAQRVLGRVDFGRLGGLGAGPGRAGRFAHLAEGAAARGAERGGRARLGDRCQSAPQQERAALVCGALAAFVAKVAGRDPAGVDRDTSLTRLGFDSLSATQLQAWLEAELGVVVPLVWLMRGPTIAELAEEALSRLAAAPAAPAAARAAWIRREAPRPTLAAGPTTARLFCFPYMAADAAAFAGFAARLPAGVELCIVSLPEIDGPLDALLRGTPDALRDALVAELLPLASVPFGFYGHSMGGFVALDAAAALRERAAPAPAFVALGALPSPEAMRALLPERAAAPEEIPDAFVLEAMRRMDMPAALLEHPRARADAIRAVRRDLWLGARTGFAGRGGAGDAGFGAIDAPALLFGGSEDPVDTIDKRPGPRVYGVAVAETHVVPGGHLFLHEERGCEALLGRLAARLEAASGTGAAAARRGSDRESFGDRT